MVKVLPGSSREALSAIVTHWRDLLKMSVIPMALYMLTLWEQLRSMSGLYRQMGSMIHGDKVDPEFFGMYFRTMSFSMLLSLLGAIALCWLFVQIIRFQRSAEASWVMMDKAGAKAALMTFAYALGMMMLTLLVYLGAAIAIVIVAAVMAMVSGGSGGVVAAILILAFFSIVAFLFWFMFRFLVGLPGVALGHSPDFFRDIWPLARSEGFGIPLRMLAATLVTYIPITILMFIFLFPALRDLIDSVRTPTAEHSPEKMFPLFANMMDRMLPAMMIIALVFIPFIWFATLLLGIAFQRFRAKQGKT